MINHNLFIYNTLSRRKELFKPIHEGKVGMYVCGPTVYNYIHIGNARPMIVFDTVRRYFEYKGYEVNYVSNFTDVDDKIIKKANEEGVDASVISERFVFAAVEARHTSVEIPAIIGVVEAYKHLSKFTLIVSSCVPNSVNALSLDAFKSLLLLT